MDTNNQIKLYDFIVVGSGIVGANIVRELSKYQASVLLLEKESDIVNGQTLANSGIIHSGHDPHPGTLKASLCVKGNELTHALEKELGYHLLRCGALVLALEEDEIPTLEALYQNGLTNKVPDIKLLDKEEVLKMEPHINKDVKKALWLPTTSVCLPWEMAIASIENAMLNGVEVRLNSEVTSIKEVNNHYEVTLKDGTTFTTKSIINATGLFSDKAAKLIDQEVEFEIKPRRGEYFTIDPKNKGFFKHVLYPLPSPIFGKGILITPQVHGETLIGPTSEDGVGATDNQVTGTGLARIMKEARRLSSDIPFYDNIRNFAGVRAKSTYDDFYIKESKEHKGVYHLGGIDSPGLTSAPAIALYLVDMIKERFVLVPKDNYIKGRNATPLFRYLSKEEKLEEIKKHPKHGHIICKCEGITEQDIINAINSTSGADTIKAVKKRTRAGAGICQGGYCERHVLRLISEYKHKKLTEINYYEENTPILLENLKRDQ